MWQQYGNENTVTNWACGQKTMMFLITDHLFSNCSTHYKGSMIPPLHVRNVLKPIILLLQAK